MIKSILAFVLMGLVMACASVDHNDPVIPAKPIDYTVGLTGKYPMTFYRDDDLSIKPINLPKGDTTGIFEVSKIDSVNIFIKATVNLKGYSIVYANNFGIKPSGADPKTFTIITYSPSQTTGTISPTEIEQQFVGSHGVITQLKGKR